MQSDKFRFYCGAASGSGRKALKKMEEPDVMISYGTAKNNPWSGIERLFTDNGAYSLADENGEYETSARHYLEYVQENKPHLYTLRDLIADPESVQRAQERTVELHRECLELHDQLGIEAEPVCVLQGWEPVDYLEHLDMLKDNGLLTDYVGVGSLKRNNIGGGTPRATTERAEQCRDILLAVREALPSKHRIHAYGATLGNPRGGAPGVLQYPDVQEAIASSDTQSYEYNPEKLFPEMWRNYVFEYSRVAHRLSNTVESPREMDAQQGKLGSFG